MADYKIRYQFQKVKIDIWNSSYSIVHEVAVIIVIECLNLMVT